MIARLAILIVILTATPAYAAADCFYDGVQYPEGSRVGVLVCENGEWVLRP